MAHNFGGTPTARKKRKEEEKRTGETKGRTASRDPAREELRKKEIATGGEFSKQLKEIKRKKEIENIATKNVDIDTKEAEILESRKPKTPEETPTLEEAMANDSLLMEEKKTEVVGAKVQKNVETEQIKFIDERGNERFIEMPIGTNDKIAEANARREGRVPFDELPVYQQFLASAAVTSVSPLALTRGGGTLNKLTWRFGKIMKSTLGKYIGGIATGSGIITWLASDNIIGTMSIYGRDLAEDVTFGKLEKERALEKFDEGKAFIVEATNFIRTATIVNPLLWPFRNIILANTEAANLAMEENRERILRA